MTVIADAPTYPHGFVVGRYLTAVADGPDLDRLMDFTPAKGKVIFTPETVIRRHEGPVPALVVQRPVTCELDDQGYLTSPGGGRGVALIAGIYTVRFDVQGAQAPGPSRIEVKATHTEAAPLDLVLAMPEVVPPGSVVVVDETTAQRAEAAAARAEAIVADIDAEVRAVVLASPELKGDKGDDGRTPDLSWQGTALAVDGVPGPDLRGPAGKDGANGAPGPAPSIKIGTVTSGTTPSATITGTSPDLTLGLVLPKGDPGTKGDPGAPGVVSSASAYVLVGPGRPDTPSTTGGVITGSEPVGAEYRSTDGASVGAWTWRKRPTGWTVTDGDTGWRAVGTIENGGTVAVAVRRTPERVEWRFTFTGALNAGAKAVNLGGIPGFGPSVRTHDNLVLGSVLAANIGNAFVTDVGRVGVLCHSNGAFFPSINLPASMGRATVGLVDYPAGDPWPTAPLPGNPA